MIVERSVCRTLAQIVVLTLLPAVLISGQTTSAQPTKTPLPEVVLADAPIYPPIARAVRISGVVHLHLATDGKRVSAITDQTGPAMLITAAEAYVRSWIFAEHTPTEFDASFSYHSQDKSECETGIKLDPAVQHLPTEAEIDISPYCDTVRFFRNKKMLAEQHAYAVELHFVINGHEVANPSEVVITNRVNWNTYHSVPLPVKDGILLIPEAMVNGSCLMFQAVVGQEHIEIWGLSVSSLIGSWTISIADKRRGDGYEFSVPKRWNVRSACVIAFEPVEGDGTNMIVSSCRRTVSK